MEKCPICKTPNSHIVKGFYKMICVECDTKALNVNGEPAKYHKEDIDDNNWPFGFDMGDNPVFIDGQKCWRKYHMDRHITMLDDIDCKSLREFIDMTTEDKFGTIFLKH